MELSDVSAAGQITIPAALLRRLGIKPGGKVLFLEEDHRIVVMNPSVYALLQAQKDFAGVAQSLGIETEQDVVDLVKEIRRERAAEFAVGQTKGVQVG